MEPQLQQQPQQQAQPPAKSLLQQQVLDAWNKHRVIKYICCIFGIICLVAIGLLFFPRIASFLSKDIPPFDDSAIVYKRISVPDSENAYFDLKKIEDDLNLTADEEKIVNEMISGNMWNEEKAILILHKNQKALEDFFAASIKPLYQDPAFSDPASISPATILPNLKSYRSTAKLNALQSIALMKAGKKEAAFGSALITLRMAQKIQESQIPLISYLVTHAMKSIALDSIQQIVVQGNVPNTILRSYIEELDTYSSNQAGYITATKDSYAIHVWITRLMLRLVAEGRSGELIDAGALVEDKKTRIDIIHKIQNHYYFKKNKTAKMFADITKLQIENADKYCDELIPLYENKIVLPTNIFSIYFTENYVGKTIFSSFGATIPSILVAKKCEADSKISTVKTVLAIYAYKNDNRNFPQKLQDLVPQYLKKIPIDYFSGNALIYLPEKKAIYSVGQNLKDDGGDIRATWATSTDYGYYLDR